MSPRTEIDFSGEGLLDAAMARKIILAAGRTPRRDFVSSRRQKGKEALDQTLLGLNAGARFNPVLVLRDLDFDAACGAELVATLASNHLPKGRENGLLLRIAVRSAEAWFMADAEALHRATGIPQSIIPGNPETSQTPKPDFISLLRRAKMSFRRRLDLADTNAVADWPKIAGWLGDEFIPDHWRPAEAAKAAPSLARCLERVRHI